MDGSTGHARRGDRHCADRLSWDSRLRDLYRTRRSAMTDIVTAIVWLAGSAFALLAAIGVLRMPDVFTRMQASTKASTLGLACLLIGAALQLGDFASFFRAASIGAFVLLTTPVAGLVIARA